MKKRAGAKHVVQKGEYELLATFRYSLRKFFRFSEEAAQAAGLTPQQHQALLAIKGYPGRDQITIGELAERLQIMHHSAVGLADRLCEEGLLRRAQARVDRRQVYLTLTLRAETLLAKLAASHREQLRRLGPEIKSTLSKLDANGKA
jgi:DNA-binding MarR family transcriptional regulator